MGLLREIFVDPAALAFAICDVCKDVLDDPVSVSCELEHPFCRVCAEAALSAAGEAHFCPTCKAEIAADRTRPEKALRRAIGTHSTYCKNKDDGCDWTGPLADRGTHVESCPLSRGHCRGCDAAMPLVDLAIHEAECKLVPRPCSNSDIGCRELVSSANAEQHLAEERAELERARTAQSVSFRVVYPGYQEAVKALREAGHGPGSPGAVLTARPENTHPQGLPWSLDIYPLGKIGLDRDSLAVELKHAPAAAAAAAAGGGPPAAVKACFSVTLLSGSQGRPGGARHQHHFQYPAVEFGAGSGSGAPPASCFPLGKLQAIANPATGILQNGALHLFVAVWPEPPA
eukprot:tig00020849_g14643.t1